MFSTAVIGGSPSDTKKSYLTSGPNFGDKLSPHTGHEFLFVLKGAIVCEFAVNERDEDTQKRTETIKTGMAVAFPSALFHRCYNNSDTEPAELMVAKPSYSDTAALKR